MTDIPSGSGRLDRRAFVTGIASAAWLSGLGCARALARIADGAPSVLSGDRIDLTVQRSAFNVTGRECWATAVNGTVPGPILRLREGDTVRIAVTNRLEERTSIHWHGLRVPADQDGVPGLSFPGIAPGATFTYQFAVRQSGTYWYHAHSGMQEQTGLLGPLILVPREREPYAYDRDYVVMLSDWTAEDPMSVLRNLKQQSDYYDYHQRTLQTFIHDAAESGLKATIDDRLMWGRMRMSPTDSMDVTGATYTFLVNGQSPAANWTGLFRPGERVRLRFINGAAMSTFDVRIPGLLMSIVAADGSDVEPVSVEEFRIGVAETYDVIVSPPAANAYTIFAQAQDRSGFARGTLAPRAGMEGEIPTMDPRPLRTMLDMGMAMGTEAASPKSGAGPPAVNADGVDPRTLAGRPFVDNVPQQTRTRLAEPGVGLDGNGRRVLVYADLKALKPDLDNRDPEREIEFHLTGNMRRYVWGFDGLKFSEAGPVRVKVGERVRFVLVNDTMMEHPIHLHGFLFSLENGNAGQLPLKHTINVKPAERLSFLFTADTPGYWAFHCHLMYHMEGGMFRTVLVA